MTNNWNIPDQLEQKIRERDKICVYCHIAFRNNAKDKTTWEHIDNDDKNITEDNIVLCCASCNASKGTKKLLDWFNSPYCKKKNIKKETVARIIQKYLEITI